MAFHTSYRMSDFFNGNEVPNTLHNLLTALRRRRDSYLAQAIATDVDAYDPDREETGKRNVAPDLVEFDLTVSLLTTVVEVLQQIRDFTAGHKRSKAKPLPRPKTARDLYAQEQMRLAREHVESVLVFVPDDQWRRNIEAAGGD